VTALPAALPESARPDEALVDRAKALDKHCVLPRSPNGFDVGAPGDYYTRVESDAAIAHGEAVLAFCRDRLR